MSVAQIITGFAGKRRVYDVQPSSGATSAPVERVIGQVAGATFDETGICGSPGRRTKNL